MDTHIKIGCELHSISEWESFSDDEIDKMDDAALAWWRIWKEPILAIAKRHAEGQR
jgi:hypothetical protein